MAAARHVLVAGLLLAGSVRLGAAPALPLQEGEHLTYRVSWAIVPGAGEIKIDATTEKAGDAARLKVTTSTATRRLARMLLSFDAKAESTYDLATGRLLSLHETAHHRNKRSEHTVTFDYPARQALYTSAGAAPRPLPLPDGNPSDLIMALLQTRTWDLKVGESRDALVLFDDDFYELTIHALRYEDVRTSVGTFRTLVLEPRMDKTPPKGMFKKGASVHVWIAQDEQRLPVKFEVEFKIGTGTATLAAYTPPAGASTPESPPPATSTDAKNSSP